MRYKLGSLFDGSGGFPLAGTLCGIEPVWAAEVEPYPIAVTRSRFPKMRHLGDISKINGAEIEPVDIITFGSPCQDLSVAGKRAGLKHEANGDEETTRSGLFMEAVRIIKEMRSATNGEYPRFALWENVPGAFSSNNGEDFRLVCEELIKIVEPSASMPAVPQNGWNYADSYIGDGWSLAYRVFDAQYWGVPQRRRRIHLVADFRGPSARAVLFEREGVRGYFTEGRTPWQGAPTNAQTGAGADDREGEGFDGYNGDLTGDKSATLGVNCGVSTGRNGVIERGRQLDAVAYSFDSLASNSMKSPNPHSRCRQVDIAKTLDTTDPNPSKNQGGIAVVESIPYTLKIQSGCEGGGKGALIQEDKSATLATNNDQYLFQPLNIIDSIGGQAERGWEGDIAPTLKATHYKSPPCITVPSAGFCTEHSAQARGIGFQEECAPTLRAGVTPSGGLNEHTPIVIEPIPIHDQATRFAGKRGSKTDGKGNGLGIGEPGAPMNTLTSADRHAVVYAIDQQGGKGGANYAENVMPTLCSDSHGTPHGVVYAIDQGGGKSSANVSEDRAPTLCTTHGGEPAVAYPPIVNDNPSYSFYPQMKAESITFTEEKSVCLVNGTNPGFQNGVLEANYIVRRLTPTECARLQGFADWWGHIEEKKSLTDEEYHFWLEVRNTHAAINGRATKDYTKKAMLTWYNKLWTDSAEYKMWGNGIALPPALYCLQGIADALTAEDNTEDDDWMS